jgi:hypothetical protein
MICRRGEHSVVGFRVSLGFGEREDGGPAVHRGQRGDQLGHRRAETTRIVRAEVGVHVERRHVRQVAEQPFGPWPQQLVGVHLGPVTHKIFGWPKGPTVVP